MHEICHWSANRIQTFTPEVRWNLQYRNETTLYTVNVRIKTYSLAPGQIYEHPVCKVTMDHNASEFDE
jgi:hypothetical protein